MGRPEKRHKETFIFYTTTKGHDGIDIYAAEPKCVNYCPRCIEMKRRIEALFRNPPSDREQDLCAIFSCPPCADVVHKFRKFSAEVDLPKREDSEIIHLQRLTSPSLDQDECDTARARFEDLIMGGAKDNVLTEKEREKDNEQTKKETAKDKDLKTKTRRDKNNELTKKESATDKDLKTKTGRDKKNELAKKERGENDELTKKESATDKDLKTKTSKLPKLSDKRSKDAVGGTVKDKGRKKKESVVGDKDLKPKTTQKAQKSPGKTSKEATNTVKGGGKIISSSRVGNIDSKKDETGKTPKAIPESKITNKAPSPKEPSIKSKSATKLIRLSAEANPLIRIKIADHVHKQAKENQKREKEIERAKKLEEEAKIARARAEEARQLKFKAAMQLQYNGPEIPSSEDRGTDVCSDETVVDCMIKGNKIVKASAISATRLAVEQVEKPIAAVLPSITTRSSVTPTPAHPPPPTPDTNSMKPDHSSGSRQLHEGHVRYNLSDRKYVDKGWTLLPREMVMRKVTLFHMHPARNEFDWLEMNRHKERVLYETGQQLATFYENGCARVYYRSGVLALDFYQAQDKNAGGYRVVVYSDGKAVEPGRAPLHTVLASFDYSGNGAVFDHTGQPRLKYSQNDGVVLDRSIGPYTHWKWHNLNGASRLQTVLVENEPIHKDPKIIKLGEVIEGKRGKVVRQAKQGDEKAADNSVPLTNRGSDKSPPPPGQEIELDEPISSDEIIMRSLESENVVKENCRLLKGFSPYQIKMKAFKINDNFSLRIIDQSSVFLTFSDGKTRLRINVGMVMDPTVVLGQDLIEVGEVTNSLEKIAASESMIELQRVVRGARAAERARVLRENRFNPPVSSDPPLPSSVKGRSHMH